MIKIIEQTKKHLDKNSFDRLVSFSNYKDGWAGNGIGKKFNIQSLKVLKKFLNTNPTLKTDISIFLEYNGYLQFSFEDKNKSTIELDFLPNCIVVFYESGDIENLISLNDIENFKTHINGLL